MRRLRSVGLVPLCAALVLVACSSGSGTASLDGGSSGTTASPVPTTTAAPSTAVPQAIVRAKLGTGESGTCSQAGKSFTVGSFTPPTPVAKGAKEPGGTVNLTCKVAFGGGTYAVTAGMDVANGDGGSFSFEGEATTTGTASGDFLAGFHLPGLDYGSTTCTLDPAAATDGVGGIAAGRFWTAFHCTGARANGSSDLCVIDGEIRIENCTQQ